MVYFASSPPDITESLPLALGTRTIAIAYQTVGAKFDIGIEDMPFLLAATDNTPYVRQTASSTKQQLDTSPEPGEQTLSQWWTRTQDSWHLGAGINYYEPGNTEGTRNRYRKSRGLDVWAKGQISLLRKLDLARPVASSEGAFATSAVVGGVDVAFLCQAGVVYRWDGSTATPFSSSGGAPATAPVIAGSTVLVGTTQGILAGSTTGGALSALYATPAGNLVTPYWVKGRIIATRAAAVYEMALATGGTLPTPLYTHPDPEWTWTGAADTPDAILLSGYSNGYGAIYRFRLVADSTTAGSVPTLGAAEQVAEFPPGEEVHAIRSYLGGYVAIGTSQGVRVGVLGDNSSVSYGPLSVQCDNPVRALAVRDSFIYAGVQEAIDGSSGCARISLADQVDDNLRFAWAWDVQTGGQGQVPSVTFLGNSDRVVLGVTGHGVYLQSATEYVSTGYLYTGIIRYGTSVPKMFALTQIRADLPGGTGLSVSSVRGNSETFVLRMDSSFNTDEDIALPTIDTPLPELELKLTLEGGSTSPTLKVVTLKSIPQPRIQRLVQIPLMIFDREVDRNGVKVGYDGSAWARLSALEALEESRSLVVVKDFTTGESFRAWIQQIEFTRSQPPVRGDANTGGRLNVTVLKL